MTRLFNLLILSFILVNTYKLQAQTTVTSSDLQCTVAGLTSGTINRKIILDAGELSLAGTAAGLYQIASFHLTRVRKNLDPIELTNASNGSLSDEMRQLIITAVSGDKLYFEYIKLKSGDGSTRSLGALMFKVE